VKLAWFPSLLLTFVSAGGALATEMKPPTLSFAQIDWAAAVATLADPGAPRPAALPERFRPNQSSANGAVAAALVRLNAVTSQQLADVVESPVPVLLPFDTTALPPDQAAGAVDAGNEGYLTGFHAAKFFHPGPAGYDAAFVIRSSGPAKFSNPMEVQISGSALLYELDLPIAASGTPVPALEEEFPGIRRLMLEHHLRYTFVRFGVPYVVSIGCFDASVPRYKMPTCRTAEQVALRFLRALRMVGGMPHRASAATPPPIQRPAELSPSFTYHGPGRLLSDTSYNGQRGRPDHTVYSQIRFPLAEAPAYANSERYRSRNRARASEPDLTPQHSYPWRDNFCEPRGFLVGQCPAGIGHQGQDIRPMQCKPAPGMHRCEKHDDVVAVRDGVIRRLPKQEAAYLFVNTANEHIRFRYLHMNPRKMDTDNLLSGRRVREGEVIGQVSNFNKRENGTSYHLHFDIQVPTKDGWVFVNPYMTLVAAYERLIGARGVELSGPVLAATGNPAGMGAAIEPTHTAQRKVKRVRYAKHRPYQYKKWYWRYYARYSWH